MQTNVYTGGMLDGVTTQTDEFPDTEARITSIDEHGRERIEVYQRSAAPDDSGGYVWTMTGTEDPTGGDR